MGYIESFEKHRRLGNTSGLVREFLIALKNAGVEVEELQRTDPKSNARMLKKEDVSVAVIPKESGPTAQGGWWGVMENIVEHLKNNFGGKWGVVFLRRTQKGNDLDVGFSVMGDNFMNVLEGSEAPSGDGQYKFHGCYLEEKPHTQKFHSFAELKSLRLLSGLID